MRKALKKIRLSFSLLIVSVIVGVVGLMWGLLQWYGASSMGKPASISEVHHAAENNQPYAEYIEQQKAYEAHFVTLASDIKSQEYARFEKSIAITALVSIVLGAFMAFLISKKLMKPVEEAYQSQERFIQDAAHELRNPLAAITATFQQSPASVQKSPFGSTVWRQTKRLIAINEDLIFLERAFAKYTKISNPNLSLLLEDVLEELSPLSSKKQIDIKTDIQPDIFKTMVPGDYVRLIKNIIDNAIKYTHQNGKISVSQKIESNQIKIIVQDNGIGIPTSDIQKIGNRFYRASNSGNVDGTGLGIAIVNKILNSYGGNIHFKSQADQGTCVTIKLPK